MKTDLESLQNLVFMRLVNDSPVLSGNMVNNITCGINSLSKCEVIIEAPFYDLKKWKKEGVIVHTGSNKNGYTDYATLVNEVGAFGRHNRSEHWVNRSIFAVVNDYANMIGATVINKLPM